VQSGRRHAVIDAILMLTPSLAETIQPVRSGTEITTVAYNTGGIDQSVMMLGLRLGS